MEKLIQFLQKTKDALRVEMDSISNAQRLIGSTDKSQKALDEKRQLLNEINEAEAILEMKAEIDIVNDLKKSGYLRGR